MKPRPWSSLRLRLIAAAFTGLIIGLALAAWALIAVYRASVLYAFDERLEGYSQNLIANIELDRDGNLYLRRPLEEPAFEQAYSGWYWQIAEPTDDKSSPWNILLRSRSLWDGALLPPKEWRRAAYFTRGPDAERLRIISRRVELPRAEAPYDIAVAGKYSDATDEISNYIGTLGVALAILAAVTALAGIAQVQFVLSPMRRVQRALHDVRSGDAQALEGAFPSEIQPLVTELNALLAHNKEVLTRARTQVGNLAHALKTPLSVLRGEVESGEVDAPTVKRETETMRRQVDHYLARARAAAAANVLSARTLVAPRAASLARAMTKIHGHRGVDFEAECPDELCFRGEAEDLDEMLGNLMDNAGKWARSRVALTAWSAGDGRILITVDDDGPGLSAEERAAVTERGQRLDESVPGSGLGLSIVRDIAALYGGALSLERAPAGGLRARLALPAAM